MALERPALSRGVVKKACVYLVPVPLEGRSQRKGEGLARATGCPHCVPVKSVFDGAVLQIGHSVSLTVHAREFDATRDSDIHGCGTSWCLSCESRALCTVGCTASGLSLSGSFPR